MAKTVEPLFVPDHCANCDAPLEMENQSLFCDGFCMYMAESIRWLRRVQRDSSRRNNPITKDAVDTRMALLIAGRYYEEERRLSPAERLVIIERDGGKCGADGAIQVDHIDGDSPDPANLQLLCVPCHNEKTKSGFVPASEEQKAWAADFWKTRIVAKLPFRLSDDETRWTAEWKGLKGERVQRLWRQLENDTGTTRKDYVGIKWQDVVALAYSEYFYPE
jgi:5-methylcytosine-specific restriction endonuclease McrA